MTKKLSQHKRRIVFALILALLLTAAGSYYYLRHSSNSTSTVSPETGNTVTKIKDKQDQNAFNPKTNSEQAIRTQTSPSPASQATPKALVKPIIIGTDQSISTFSVEASEGNQSSGTCTATLTRSGYADQSVSTSVAKITYYYVCQTMRFNLSTLVKGDWGLVVAYSSDTAAGVSDKQTVSIK